MWVDSALPPPRLSYMLRGDDVSKLLQSVQRSWAGNRGVHGSRATPCFPSPLGARAQLCTTASWAVVRRRPLPCTE